MRSTFKTIFIGALALAAGALSCATPAHADAVAFRPYDVTTIGSATADATAGYTNSTVTYSDITGASVVIPATNKPWSGKQFIRVCYGADVTKATSTTGIIGVYANGAVIAASERATSSGAARNTMYSCYTVARASGLAQTVKLQGKSGDTALFTVSNLTMSVSVLFAN